MWIGPCLRWWGSLRQFADCWCLCYFLSQNDCQFNSPKYVSPKYVCVTIVDTFFQPQTLSCLGGRHLVEILGRVSFESTFGRILVALDWRSPKTDHKLTQSRPLASCSVRVCSLRGVRVCGWNKSVDTIGCFASCLDQNQFPKRNMQPKNL